MIKRRTLERPRLVLRKEKLEGDLGDEGLEKRDNLGLSFVVFLGLAAVVVLHWSLGLLGTDEVVLHRRLGLETGWDCNLGVEGLEKNPNFEPNLGLWSLLLLQCCCCCFFCFCFCFCWFLSDNTGPSLSLGIDVQKARLQPVTIAATRIFSLLPF